MIQLFSTEFWIIILFIVNFILVVFLFLVVKRINCINPLSVQPHHAENHDAESDQAGHIIKMLEPLVKDAAKTARSFEVQIREKKRIIKESVNS